LLELGQERDTGDAWKAVSFQSCHSWLRAKPVDRAQDVHDQLTRNRRLRHLERDLAAVAGDLRADLNQALAAVGQRSVHGVGLQSERAKKLPRM
jgi:hypothetical protein